MPFTVTPTALPEVLLLSPKVFGDHRGYFFESYNERDFADATALAGVRFVQDNQSRSRRGVLRGLHYQITHPQGKLVRVLEGEIFDVAVDLRRSSRTYGQWAGARLSADDKTQIWVPAGFAHGFVVLSEVAEILYKTTDYWHPEHERVLRWNDPTVAIRWPIDFEPQLAARDAAGPSLAEAEAYP